MTPKQEQEKIQQLEKELQKVIEQRDGLQKRVAELEAAKPPSKSRMQAVAALGMLKEGPVSVEQLVKLNPKYPSDAVYYVRTLLKQDVKLVRRPEGNVYMLPEQFATYQAGIAKEKASKEASEKEAKESIQTSQETVAA
jgi:hypothetical protein